MPPPTLDPTDALAPVHLAYLAAAIILPARLAIILVASRDVPRLHARVRQQLASEESTASGLLLRSSNPYADLSQQLIIAAKSGKSASELGALRQRAIQKAGRRNLRSQALDATSLMLLLGLSLRGEHGLPLGELAAWGAGFIGLLLLCTIFARGSLQHRLDTALRELESDLVAQPRRPSHASACAFCGAHVEPARVDVTARGVTTQAAGAMCQSCGKVVATVEIT